MAEIINFYDIVKNIQGSLALVMPSHDMTAPARTVSIAHNVKKVRIPRTFALGIFVDPTLEQMYKDGKFKIEPEKQFEAEVAEIFYPVTDKKDVLSDSEIVKMLQQGNRVAVKKALESSVTNRDNLIILARANIGSIPYSMIQDLNNILGIELQVENEEME